MKTFLIAAACFAVAVAGPARFVAPGAAGPAPVVDADKYEPISVGPAIVGDDSYEPISVGPAIVGGDSYEPISVGPAIVGDDSYEPISVGPAIVGDDSYEPISVGPAIVDGDDTHPITVGPAIVDPVAPGSVSSPLVYITINVNTGSDGVVSVDQVPGAVIERPEATPVVERPEPVEEIEPTPVIVVESAEPEIEPTPVIVVEEAEIAQPAPVNIPETLN